MIHSYKCIHIWTHYGPIHTFIHIWTHYEPIMDPLWTHYGPIWTHSYTCIHIWTHYGPIHIRVIYTYIYTAPHPAPASGAQAGIYITKNDSDSMIVAGNRVKAMLYDSDMKAMILICILYDSDAGNRGTEVVVFISFRWS